VTFDELLKNHFRLPTLFGGEGPAADRAKSGVRQSAARH
jgi:hypothetical protein